jgi:hypothetical protein
MLGRDKSEVGHEPRWGSETCDIIDLTQERECGERLDPSEAAESLDLRPIGDGTSGLFELGVEGPDLRLEILKVFKIDRESRLEMPLQRCSEMPEPEEVLLGPSGLGAVKNVAVVAQRTGDAVLGGGDLGMITSPEAQETPQGLVVFGRNMDWGEVPTAV